MSLCPNPVGTGCVECGGTCTGHVYDAALLAWRETLARNLRDAAGCALAWRLRRDFGNSWERGDCDAWCPNLDGAPAPGWER